MELTSGKELALRALKKEFVVLTKKADKAKAICEECMNCASEIIKVRMEALELMKSDIKDKHPKLVELAKREKRAFMLSKKPLSKIMDQEFEASYEKDELSNEITKIEFRQY
jgi:hypothetical protein